LDPFFVFAPLKIGEMGIGYRVFFSHL
jgi:hypothetical protein